MEKIKQAIYEALGAASMCWSETPKGTFDSTKANKIGEDLIQKLYPELPQKEEIFMDRLIKERGELHDKFFKLTSFLDTGEQNVVSKIGQTQFDYLLNQHNSMANYLLMLDLRIEDLNKDQVKA